MITRTSVREKVDAVPEEPLPAKDNKNKKKRRLQKPRLKREREKEEQKQKTHGKRETKQIDAKTALRAEDETKRKRSKSKRPAKAPRDTVWAYVLEQRETDPPNDRTYKLRLNFAEYPAASNVGQLARAVGDELESSGCFRPERTRIYRNNPFAEEQVDDDDDDKIYDLRAKADKLGNDEPISAGDREAAQPFYVLVSKLRRRQPAMDIAAVPFTAMQAPRTPANNAAVQSAYLLGNYDELRELELRDAILGDARNAEAMVEALMQLPAATKTLNLHRINDMFNEGNQNDALGPFSRSRDKRSDQELTIPFFFGSKLHVDTRFLDMSPPDVDVAPFRLKEAKELAEAGSFALLGVAGGGKTTTLFDLARVIPTVYVQCESPFAKLNLSPTKLDEEATNDQVFPPMAKELHKRCNDLAKAGRMDLARDEAVRLMKADICARLALLLAAYRQHPNATPEQILLLQLYGGRERMLSFFKQLACETDANLTVLMPALHEELQQLTTVTTSTATGETQDWKLRVAIDRAQAVGSLYKQPEKGIPFHFDTLKNHDSSFLHQYLKLWRSLSMVTVVAGTGMTEDVTTELPSNIGKPSSTRPVILPVLTVDDVKARLERVLDLSDVDWNDVPNVALLAGRCCWVAAVISSLIKEYETCKDQQQIRATAKVEILNSTINSIIKSTKMSCVAQWKRRLTKQDAHFVVDLVKRLYAIVWLFGNRASGVKLLFSRRDINNILALGFAQLVDISGGVRPDPVGAIIVKELGRAQKWDLVPVIAEFVLDSSDQRSASKLGYSCELLVAAALANYDGSIADLIRELDPATDAPEWTTHAHTKGFQYYVLQDSNVVNEVFMQALQNTQPGSGFLISPSHLMGPDLIGLGNTQEEPPRQFLLTGSQKLWEDTVSGNNREHDLETTKLEKAFKLKSSGIESADDKEQRDDAHAQFRPVVQQVITAVGNRRVRVHTCFPRYAKVGNKAKPAAVQVDSDGVRLIIDYDNHDALFASSDVLKEVRAHIAKKKGWNLCHSERKKRKQEHAATSSVQPSGVTPSRLPASSTSSSSSVGSSTKRARSNEVDVADGSVVVWDKSIP